MPPNLYIARHARAFAVYCRPDPDGRAGDPVVYTDTKARAYRVRRQLLTQARRCDVCGLLLQAHTPGRPPADRADRFGWGPGDITYTPVEEADADA
jgi:hypothetical protein